jgi:hypothetical protein
MPGLEPAVVQSPTVAPSPRDVADSPSALDGGALETGRGGVGRAVDAGPSGIVCERIDSSPDTAERIIVGLNICFEGPGANELFGLVLADLFDLLPDRLRGLERVSTQTLARVTGGEHDR